MTQANTGNDLGLRTLARVNGELDAAAIDAILPYEGDEPYFPDYVDANLPRDWETTDSIVAATKGHAIADEDGSIIARFEGVRDGKTSLQRAEEARAGARVTLALDVPTDEATPAELTDEGADSGIDEPQEGIQTQ